MFRLSVLCFFLICHFSSVAQQLVFEEVQNTPFVGVWFSAVEAADFNGDGRQDVIIAGATKTDQSNRIVTLYMNDCYGNFTEKKGTPFEGVLTGSIEAFDKDNDGDLDLVITGKNNFNQHTINIYENDGNANFTKVTTNMIGVWQGETAVADYDKDGDLDIVVTGFSIEWNPRKEFDVAHLYLNDGMGNFELKITDLIGTRLGSTSAGDFNNDGYPDLLISGMATSEVFLFKNLGGKGFQLVEGNNLISNHNGVSKFIDLDGDYDLDVIVTGYLSSGNATYINHGNDEFKRLQKSIVPYKIMHSAIEPTDVDLDGDLDFIITGDFRPILGSEEQTYGGKNSLVYINKGNLNFEPLDVGFEGVYQGNHIAVADFNNDRTNDVFIVGESVNGPIAKMYLNKTPYLLEDIAKSTKMDTLKIDTCYSSYTLPSGRETLTVSGVYLDTLSSRFGCDSTFFVDVTINQDSYSTLFVNSFGCYKMPNGLEAVNESGLYYDTIPNAAGCDSIMKINLEVLPKNSSVYQDGKILHSQVTEADSFQWINCSTGKNIDDATDSVFVPKVNGEYAVITTIANCSDTSACFPVDNLDCVFEVYPNPTREKVKLYLGCEQEEISISVKNSVGQFIQEYEYRNVSEIDLMIDPANGGGVYFLEITTQDLGTKGLKVIKY